MSSGDTATWPGAATTVQANPAYTGEAQWSGGAYVQLAAGCALSWPVVAADQQRLLQAIVNRMAGPAGSSTFTTGGTRPGTAQYGNGDAQGNNSATPVALLPVTLVVDGAGQPKPCSPASRIGWRAGPSACPAPTGSPPPATTGGDGWSAPAAAQR